MEKTQPYDSANYLETKEDIAYYLEACFEEDAENSEFIVEAFRTITRAKCFDEIVKVTHLSREHLLRREGQATEILLNSLLLLDLGFAQLQHKRMWSSLRRAKGNFLST